MASSINYETFSKNIENRNHTRVCRFCLDDHDDAKATRNKLHETKNAKTIAQLFKAVTDVDLSFAPEYPTFVCKICESNLRIAAKTRIDVMQMENCWKKFIDEMPSIEEIKIEEVDVEDISFETAFETVEMVIEPIYTTSVFEEHLSDSDMKSGFEVKVKNNISDADTDSSNDNFETFDVGAELSDSQHSDLMLNSSPTSAENNCQYCKVTDLTSRELQKHQRNCHPELLKATQFLCDICDKTYLSRHGIHTHMKRHAQDRSSDIQTQRYKCSFCDTTFGKKSQLNEHELFHSDITPHICHICGVGRKSRHSLNNHLRTHNTDLMKKQSSLSRRKSSKRYYTCWLCPTRIDFKTLEELKSHRKNLHHKFECEYCKNGFMTNEALQSHVLIHRTQDRPHVCKFCGGTFSKIGHLNSHIQGKHALQKPHPCDKCPKGFVHRYQLQSHIRIFHDKIKAFHCTECPISFGHAKSRVWHMRTVHKKNM